MHKVSVVVPVYNAEKSIRRCVNSILTQTFNDYELLLVNDGSTDNSGAICNEYAKQDARVRVFHKDNGGVSSARNLGMDNAQGEWIVFVDSDDSVSDTYLSNLLSHSVQVDLVISYAEIVHMDNRRIKEQYNNMIVTTDYDALFIYNDLNWHTSPWAKLFKASLCKDLRFVEGMHIGEDLVFLYSYMLKCSKIYVSSDTDYKYFVDSQGSLTKRINNLSEELVSYGRVKDVVNEVIQIKKITKLEALSKLGWIIAYYVRRVLNAIYCDGKHRTMCSRIKCIRSLDIDKYVNYIEISSNKERIYLFLLKNRLYVLYDLIRILVVWVKK